MDSQIGMISLALLGLRYFDENVSICQFHLMPGQRFLRRWINRFSSQQIEPRQVKCTCDAVPGEKAHGQVVLLVSTGSIPRVDCSFNVDDEDPFTLVFYSLHGSGGKLGDGTHFDESAQKKNRYRYL